MENQQVTKGNQKYYVSGCVDNGIDIETVEDDVAEFWTLYERDAKGLSLGIVDLRFREDAEAVMAVYMERDLLRATIIDMNAVLNQKCAIDDRLTLELQSVEAERDALQEQVKALAAENLMLKSGPQGFFSYGTDSGFEEHESAEKAIAAAGSDIDYYRGDACDGWSEETDQTVWGVIMQRATVTGLRPVTEDDSVGSHISEMCDYTLLPDIETPAIDAAIRDIGDEAVSGLLKAYREHVSKAGLSLGNDVTVREAIDALEHCAAQLRANPEGVHP